MYKREREYHTIERKRGKVEVKGEGKGVFILAPEGYYIQTTPAGWKKRSLARVNHRQ
jgi:hypothetical protein